MWIGSSSAPQISGASGSDAAPDAVAANTRLSPNRNLRIRSSKPEDDGRNEAGDRIGVASAGTWVVTVGNAKPIEVNGVDQYWVEVKLEPVVFIQNTIDAENIADSIGRKLDIEGFSVPASDSIPAGIGGSYSAPFQVRFYLPQDEEAAERVCEAAASAFQMEFATCRTDAATSRGDTNAALRDLSKSALAERVKSGTIELWLFGGEDGTR